MQRGSLKGILFTFSLSHGEGGGEGRNRITLLFAEGDCGGGDGGGEHGGGFRGQEVSGGGDKSINFPLLCSETIYHLICVSGSRGLLLSANLFRLIYRKPPKPDTP